MTIKTFEIRGKKYTVKKSNRKDKKYMVDVNGKTVHFGAKNYGIFPGTKRGDNYCARSSGIKSSNKPMLERPNFWSRMMWACQGKKSKRT